MIDSHRGLEPARDVSRAAQVRSLATGVGSLSIASDPRECVDQLDELERLKSAICAAQARLTEQLSTHREAQAEARRLADPKRRWPNPDSGIGMEIGFARREAPHTGRRLLGLARSLCHDLPATMAALEAGDINEHRAQIIATETAQLSRSQRAVVDETISQELTGLGDQDLTDAVRREVLRIDEAGYLARRDRSRNNRRVTGRLLGDGIAQVNATMTSEDHATVMLALSDAAEAARTAGDGRTRAQLMVDTLIAKVTGRHLTSEGHTSRGPVAVKLLVSAETLLGDSCEPGYVVGCGHVPASVAREMASSGAWFARSTLQRIFHFPHDGSPQAGQLVAMESGSTRFRGALADYVRLRDHRCRTPHCNAPIRHIDHVRSRADHGDTSERNGQGLCEACNYAKESPGFSYLVDPDQPFRHVIDITTPTGHRHRSRAPAPPTPIESSSVA